MSENGVMGRYGTAFRDVEDNRNAESGWSIVQPSGVWSHEWRNEE